MTSFQLDRGTTEDALRSMVDAELRPYPEDPVFYREVRELDLVTTEVVRPSLSLTDVVLPAAEAEALEALAARVVACADAPSNNLFFYVVQAGWLDDVGSALHGVAVVDVTTHEALWVHVYESWTT